MQLIIPMTGEGSRFAKAGFEHLKPFIKVHGKSLLWWVLQVFPQITKFEQSNVHLIFRAEHFEQHDYLAQELSEIAPLAQIHLLKNWDQKGPVPNILQVINNPTSGLIEQEPIFISYCDFYLHWNFEKYIADLKNLDPDGSIPCYSGFHPHLLHPENLYANCQVDEQNNLVEVKEKFSFTKDKTKSLHSPGIYYFKNLEFLKKYFSKAVGDKSMKFSTNGEFYCSLPFNLMIQDGLKVFVPNNVEYFCQWGTPKDLQEYLWWMQYIKSDCSDSKVNEQCFKYWREFSKLTVGLAS